ncbi:S8 family serine peptidase [Streptomyces sp. NPDC051940]|uniref:S8 family peptidase n=1 Tax=Streptomyces sp. NPDC051940 TaxID=3155675 RepID=UPI003425032A
MYQRIQARRLIRLRPLCAATASLLCLLSAPGAAASSPAAAATDARTAQALSAPGDAVRSRLTLVTGDTVTLATRGGRVESVDIVPTGGRPTAYHTTTGANGDLYVYPEAATDEVDAGLVDAELFNVTRQLRDGLADSASDRIPALVRYAGRPSAAALRDAAGDLPASERGVVLPKLGMGGVEVEKKNAEDFFRAVSADGGDGPEVTKVWYDGKVKADLDRSTAQIGAPEAWAAGYDGTGAKVAVLDSGIDLTHPDFAGRIAESRSFVAGEDVRDGFGHGTHVASIVAGSGAAADGKYRGVAPGADLMIGKVLNNKGGGDFSEVLAGMEWAAAAGADVVNMSLGTTAIGPRDALTDAVDALSASTGTLFVIASGNYGPDEISVATPATAPSALTVGAVDRSDALAAFSSRGPRIGDAGIKPEITAPGVGIVAARSAGTVLGTPVGDRYTTMNGTSMATPHVAGAAAILAQRHPEWSGAQIKAALTGHAKPVSGQTVYQQGYGRLDVPAALDAELNLAGIVDYGLVLWQDGTFDKRPRTLTLSNSGSEAVTLDLDLAVRDTKGNPLPDGALTLQGADGGSVTVPAGGSAEVTAVLDPNLVPAERWTGALTATAADGRTVHTPVGFIKEAPKRALTIDFKDRFGGTPPLVEMTVQGLDNKFVAGYRLRGRDSYTLRLPLGRYSVMGTLTTDDPAHLETVDFATDVFAFPEVDITRQDQAMTADARQARDLSLQIRGEDRPLEGSHFSLQMQRTSPDGAQLQLRGVTDTIAASDKKYGIVPSAKAETGEFVLSTTIAAREPLQRLAVTSPVREQIAVRAPVNATRFDGTMDLELVDAGAGSQAEIDAAGVAGKAVLITSDNLVGITDQARRAAAGGAKALVAVPPREGPRYSFVGTNLPIPVTVADYQDGRRLLELTAGGSPVTVAFGGVYESGYTYTAQYYDTGALPADATHVADQDDFATVVNTFHSDRTRRVGWEFLNTSGPYAMPSIQTGQALGQGGTRVDHILADEEIAYQQMVLPHTSYSAQLVGPWTVHAHPRRTTRDTWYAAPMHPAAYTDRACSFCRTDAGTVFTDNVGGDGEREHAMVSGRLPTWTYYRDGVQVTDVRQLMVPGPADYRVVMDTKRFSNPVGVSLGTTTRTEWSFRSAAPQSKAVKGCETVVPGATRCEALPVLLLDYRLQLSILNEAPAGRSFEFAVRATRPQGTDQAAAVAGAKVSVSYDDGVTWSDARIRRDDPDSFEVTVGHPALAATNGFVTLRTEVWDSEGNRTVETINRAYALK